jgi:hypothetical protein
MLHLHGLGLCYFSSCPAYCSNGIIGVSRNILNLDRGLRDLYGTKYESKWKALCGNISHQRFTIHDEYIVRLYYYLNAIAKNSSTANHNPGVLTTKIRAVATAATTIGARSLGMRSWTPRS